MATEDKYIITVDTTNARVSIDTLEKKIQSFYRGMTSLQGVSENTAAGTRRFTFEVKDSALAVNKLAAANDKLSKSYKSVNVSSKFKAGKKGTPAAVPTPSSIVSTVNPFAGMTPGATLLPPTMTKEMPLPVTMRGVLPPAASTAMPPYISPNMMPMAPKTFGMPEGIGTAMNTLFPASEKIATESGRINKMLADINKPAARPEKIEDTKAAFKKAGIDTIGYGDKKFVPTQQKVNKEQNKYAKGLKDITKTTFMLQMGMLGVAFSTQALIGSIQGLIMGAITGLADTETAVQNAVMSEVFGSDMAGMMGVDIDQIVDSSLKAKGTLADLNSVLIDIATKVFSNPETVEKIKNAFVRLAEAFSNPQFIDSVTKFVESLTKPEFIDSLTNLATKLVELMGWLGEKGLLDKILLLVIACQLLMPLFAALQLLLLLLGAATLGTLLLYVAGVVVIVWSLVSAMGEWGKTGNFVLDAINVVITALLNLLDVLLFIPSAIFDYIQGAIEELTGGLVKIGNPFKEFTNFLRDSKDFLIGGTAGLIGATNYTEASSNTTIVFNKPVGQNAQDDVLKALTQSKNQSY